jgi:NADH dehydrogenase
MGMPIQTFGGTPAKLLKKSIAVRWIAKVSSTGRAASAFGDM